MKRDPGDIVDRFSIACLKKENIGCVDSILEAAMFRKGFVELKKEFPHVQWQEVFSLLFHINKQIWELESALRQGMMDVTPLQCGKVAIEVRKVNSKRVTVKNYINRALREGTQDVKQDHISSGTPEDFISFEEFCAQYVLPRRNGIHR